MSADVWGPPEPGRQRESRHRWLLALGPLALIVVLIGGFWVLGGPGLGDRDAPPVEELVVERTALHPGELVFTLRNEGPDAVQVAQVNVDDFYAPFTQTRERIGRLESSEVTVAYPWIEGAPYEVAFVTSTGGKIATAIDAASASPARDGSFVGLMALLGLYVGVIPVALGMLWLPFVRRAGGSWIRGLLAFTVGLLAFLVLDALVEGVAAVSGSEAFEGPLVVFLGVIVAYVALEGVEGVVRRRRGATGSTALSAGALSLLIAIGIGLHNFGEGLAIGSAYAVGALALGAFLVVGFAIHNTTEGLAIVTPLAEDRPRLTRLALLGVIAGAPAIVGALIGSSAYQPALAAFLLGVGAGAIAQVAVKLLPLLRDRDGRTLDGLTAGALTAGVAFMFATSLLVSA